MSNKENVILIASAPKGYGKKVVTNKMNQMKRDRANLNNILLNIKPSSRYVN